jgi:hypothetical protein
MSHVPSLPLVAFVTTWNGSFPSIEVIDRKIAAKRARIASASRHGLRASLAEELGDLEAERSRVAAYRDADPDAYAVNQTYRLNVAVTRPGTDEDVDDAGLACFSWLIREFAPTWVEWLYEASPTLTGFRQFAVRLRNLPDVDSHERLLRAVPVILDFAAMAEQVLPFDGEPSHDRFEAEDTMHCSGWYAGLAGAEAGQVVSALAEAMFDRLHFAVYAVAAVAVAAHPLPFDDIIRHLRGSALRFLEDANAGKQLPGLADEPAVVTV